MSQRFSHWFASIVLMLCFSFAGTAAAQTMIDATPLGQTIRNTAINYRTCDSDDVWTARYIAEKKWRHTNSAGQFHESDIIRYVDHLGICKQANFDGNTDNLPGMFFHIYGGDCTNPEQCAFVSTQTLDVNSPFGGGSYSIQLDWSHPAGNSTTVGNILTANQWSYSGIFFDDGLVYMGCDGSLWKMTFPHLSGTPDPSKLMVSHTPLSNAGTSHYDNIVWYLNHAGTCQLTTVKDLAGGRTMYFLSGEREKRTWAHGSLQLLAGQSFQGFAILKH